MILLHRKFASRFALIATAAVAAAFSGCRKNEPPRAGEGLPPAVLRAVSVKASPRVAHEEVVGTVRAKLRAAIEPKVSARMELLLVAPGQTVKAGDLIARLDAREIQARLDQAQAVREQAVADLERARALMQQKITTQAEFDAVQARARISAGALTEAETMLGYTKVVAPFDGVITRQLADVGDLAAPGRPIVEMEDPRALRFEADIPESLVGSVKLGAKFAVRVGANLSPVDGVVAELAPVAAAATRTFLAKLDLPPAEGVRSGQFGRVLVPVGEKTSLHVPASALVLRGQVETVFVVEKQHAQLRIVRTGKQAGGEVELLAGVAAGESVVVDGAEHLRDGQPVTLKP
jgi:RND family efflux transporter MFP subunit